MKIRISIEDVPEADKENITVGAATLLVLMCSYVLRTPAGFRDFRGWAVGTAAANGLEESGAWLRKATPAAIRQIGASLTYDGDDDDGT